MKSISIFILLLFFLASCQKSEEYSTTPEIEFVSISPNPANEFSDEVTITIRYRDGDGDIGENVAGVKNLFVRDSRNNVLYEFRVQQLSPDNSEIAITGNLEVKITSVALVDQSKASESFSYKVYLLDRAGNQSNEIETDQLTVNK